MKINYEKRIFGLDLLRAIAILFVVFGHTYFFFLDSSNIFTQFLSLISFFGVEIFFVLSGFLIGSILYKEFVIKESNYSTIIYFWIRRWFRTLPSYYIVLLLNITFFLIFTYPTEYFNNKKHIWRFFVFIQNFSSEQPYFFNESWSLSIEEFTYLLAPIVLFLFIKIIKGNRKKTFLTSVLIMIFMFLISKIIYQINYTDGDMLYWNSNLKSVVIFRIDSIFYGMIATWILNVYPKVFIKYKYVFLAISIFILSFINIIISYKSIFITDYPFFWNVMYLPLQSIIVMFSIPFFYDLKQFNFMKKGVTIISLISYSMYLLHMSFSFFLIFNFINLTGLNNFKRMLIAILYLTITFIVSYLFTKYIEKPMTDLRDSKFIKEKFNKI